jgi:hypothetical protein
MNIVIQVNEDDNFKMVEASTSVEIPTLKVENVEIPQVIVPTTPPPTPVAEYYPTPQGVPLENPRSTGAHWFEGTTWSTRN